jgi:hypothetical protein
MSKGSFINLILSDTLNAMLEMENFLNRYYFFLVHTIELRALTHQNYNFPFLKYQTHFNT